jgi:hypothetical protein
MELFQRTSQLREAYDLATNFKEPIENDKAAQASLRHLLIVK